MQQERPIARLLRLAEARGMDQSALALKMGVEPQHITNWKKRGLPAARHAAAAAVVGVSVEVLLGLSADSSSTEPPRAYLTVSNNKLGVSEMVKASRGGVVERATQPSGTDLGYLELSHPAAGLVAILVRGDGLAPAIADGRVLLIAPGVDCPPGEAVHITMRDGKRLCKKVLIKKPDSILVSDLRTEEQSVIDLADVARLDLVMAIYSPTALKFGLAAPELDLITDLPWSHDTLQGGASQLGGLDESAA